MGLEKRKVGSEECEVGCEERKVGFTPASGGRSVGTRFGPGAGGDDRQLTSPPDKENHSGVLLGEEHAGLRMEIAWNGTRCESPCCFERPLLRGCVRLGDDGRTISETAGFPPADERREWHMRVHGVLRTKGTDVVTTDPSATLLEAATVLHQHRIGALLVTNDDGTVAGILSERDIVHAVTRLGVLALEGRVADAMSVEVVSCTSEDSLESLMETMTQRRIRHLPVLDDGALMGIVSIGDVVKRRLAEISDESKALQDYITSGR